MSELYQQQNLYVDARDAAIAEVAQFLTEINGRPEPTGMKWIQWVYAIFSFLFGAFCVAVAGLIHFGSLGKESDTTYTIIVIFAGFITLTNSYLTLYEYIDMIDLV